MKVFVNGVGEVTLTKNDFVFQGGEGSIYAKGASAYKIYTDPKKMIPTAKIGELAEITESKVIRPQNIILDEKSKAIGYTMRYLKDTVALCQLFTKAFRDRNGLSPDDILKLVRDMQNTVKHIHDKRCLIVDLNEMNFLVDKNYKEVYFIDVDSYQTRSFPATALMESVRDRHSKGVFNEGTDWFSFAVVSFQLFIGIHPYKGKHAKYLTMDERMEHNVSVLNKDVSIPRVCQPFDVIPEVYRKWYEAVLDAGDRLPPPFDLQARVVVLKPVYQALGSKYFDINRIFEAGDTIVDFVEHMGTRVVTCATTIYVDAHEYQRSSSKTQVAFTPKMNYVIEAHIDSSGTLKLRNLNLKQDLECPIQASEIMSYGGRLYALSDTNVLEIKFTEMSNSLIVGSKPVAKVLERATSVFDGAVVQNLFGGYYFSLFPESGVGHQVHVPELAGYRVVDAKFDNRVLMVMASRKGKYDKFVLRFARDYGSYDLRKVEDVSTQDLNFVSLDNGISATINDNEDLELFPIAGPGMKVITTHGVINSQMTLRKSGTTVLFFRGKELYSLKMK